MFCELDNVDVLFTLGDPPRIAPLTAGYPGLCISINVVAGIQPDTYTNALLNTNHRRSESISKKLMAM